MNIEQNCVMIRSLLLFTVCGCACSQKSNAIPMPSLHLPTAGQTCVRSQDEATWSPTHEVDVFEDAPRLLAKQQRHCLAAEVRRRLLFRKALEPF